MLKCGFHCRRQAPLSVRSSAYLWVERDAFAGISSPSRLVFPPSQAELVYGAQKPVHTIFPQRMSRIRTDTIIRSKSGKRVFHGSWSSEPLSP